jgi:hypothetical protein
MLGRGYGREIDKTTAVRAPATRFSGWRTNYPRAFLGGDGDTPAATVDSRYYCAERIANACTIAVKH